MIGTILKEARINNNFTLDELSRISGISKSRLSKLENGKVKNPKSFLIYRLCNILNLNYNILMRQRWAIFPTFLYK